MNMPIRIQRKRVKGFNLQSASPNGLPVVYVGRPTKWGNPLKLLGDMIYINVSHRRGKILSPWVLFCDGGGHDAGDVVGWFKEMLTDHYSKECEPETRQLFFKMRQSLEELRGKNLACFCPLDSPCHADVLLELANTSPNAG